MRLDHLLSKEPTSVLWLVCSWMFCLGAGHVFGFWVEHWLLPCFCGGALLGFEGSVAVLWLRFLCGGLDSSGFCRGFLGVCFENFIVDASIFVVFVVGFLASYLVRSVDALAPRADEGRCNLR